MSTPQKLTCMSKIGIRINLKLLRLNVSRNLQFVNALNVIMDIDDANCSFYGAIYYKKLQSLSPTDTFTLSL